jgi:hypothetical protein
LGDKIIELIEVGNVDWNENEVEMDVVVHFYFGGSVRSANPVSCSATLSVSKDTL